MKDILPESDDERLYECFDCGTVAVETVSSRCPDCGGRMRNRGMPIE